MKANNTIAMPPLSFPAAPSETNLFHPGTGMKEKDSIIDNNHQLILYVEKDDQTYGPVQTGSYMVENYLEDFFDKKEKRRSQILHELIAGGISPIAYYKELVDIGEGDLARRAGISRRKLRLHMTPKGFARINVALLERYAVIFGIPVAHLFQIFISEDVRLRFNHEPTGLPEVVITRITHREESEDG